MSTIDLSSFQTPEGEGAGTAVTMPDGTEIVLKPLMQLGPEHDEVLLELISAVPHLQAAIGGDGGGQGVAMDKVAEIMPLMARLVAAAAPSKAAAAKIAKLPLMARLQLLMGYIGDQDLGGLMPSED